MGYALRYNLDVNTLQMGEKGEVKANQKKVYIW